MQVLFLHRRRLRWTRWQRYEANKLSTERKHLYCKEKYSIHNIQRPILNTIQSPLIVC
ncbi:MAG: hypothetical protein IPL54_10000 [Chitinophagaceae bacterium]|nr:hypothetical protein [Chitinophagaceae bacterium]